MVLLTGLRLQFGKSEMIDVLSSFLQRSGPDLNLLNLSGSEFIAIAVAASLVAVHVSGRPLSLLRVVKPNANRLPNPTIES